MGPAVHVGLAEERLERHSQGSQQRTTIAKASVGHRTLVLALLASPKGWYGQATVKKAVRGMGGTAVKTAWVQEGGDDEEQK